MVVCLGYLKNGEGGRSFAALNIDRGALPCFPVRVRGSQEWDVLVLLVRDVVSLLDEVIDALAFLSCEELFWFTALSQGIHEPVKSDGDEAAVHSNAVTASDALGDMVQRCLLLFGKQRVAFSCAVHPWLGVCGAVICWRKSNAPPVVHARTITVRVSHVEAFPVSTVIFSLRRFNAYSLGLHCRGHAVALHNEVEEYLHLQESLPPLEKLARYYSAGGWRRCRRMDCTSLRQWRG